MDLLIWGVCGLATGITLVWWTGRDFRRRLGEARADRDRWRKLADEAIDHNIELAERLVALGDRAVATDRAARREKN